jgi:hypothetical protein
MANTNKDNTFSADTNHLNKRNAFITEKVALDLIDQGFSRIWISGQEPDAISGKVQVVFAGTKWLVGNKRNTEKTHFQFVTGCSWGKDSIANVTLSDKKADSITLPFKMAKDIGQTFSDSVVFIVA